MHTLVEFVDLPRLVGVLLLYSEVAQVLQRLQTLLILLHILLGHFVLLDNLCLLVVHRQLALVHLLLLVFVLLVEISTLLAYVLLDVSLRLDRSLEFLVILRILLTFLLVEVLDILFDAVVGCLIALVVFVVLVEHDFLVIFVYAVFAQFGFIVDFFDVQALFFFVAQDFLMSLIQFADDIVVEHLAIFNTF